MYIIYKENDCTKLLCGILLILYDFVKLFVFSACLDEVYVPKGDRESDVEDEDKPKSTKKKSKKKKDKSRYPPIKVHG